jgi:hypothetical protein
LVVNRIVLLSVSMGFMLSPHSLIVSVNVAGSMGPAFLIPFCVAAALFLANAFSYEGVFFNKGACPGEASLLRDSFGRAPTTALLLCSRGVVAISISTLILARAGYVFNEIFVYWFPNLGFSFALLAMILAVHLTSARLAGALHVLAAGVVLAALGTMVVIGLAGWGNPPPVAASDAVAKEGMLREMFLPFTVLIGFELAGLIFSGKEMSGSWRKTTWGALIAVSVSLGLWGLVSSMYVPAELLSTSTVPYSLAGRAIWGQSGRTILGLVVLTGCWLSVSVLLRSTAGMMARLAEASMLPTIFQRSAHKPWVSLSVLALAVGLLMALGFAGEPVTEVFVQGGIYFWLLTYAGVNLARFRSIVKQLSHRNCYLFIFISLIFAAAAVILIFTDPRSAEVVRFMVLAAACGMLPSCIRMIVSGKRSRQKAA